MTEFLLAAAGQPWIYAVVLLLCVLDGIFPPLPSEALVVGLAVLAAAEGWPAVTLLVLTAAVGAFLGDNLAYALGRRLGTRRWRWMRRPALRRAFATAERELRSRPVSVLLVARFVPVARVAVNISAGAVGVPRRQFRAIAALSASLWAGYSVAIGAVAGVWLREQPLLGLVVAVTVAALLGWSVDRLSQWLRSRTRRRTARDRTPPAVVPGAGPAQHQPVEVVPALTAGRR